MALSSGDQCAGQSTVAYWLFGPAVLSSRSWNKLVSFVWWWKSIKYEARSEVSAPLSPIWAERFFTGCIVWKVLQTLSKTAWNPDAFEFKSNIFFFLHTAADGFSIEHLVNSNTAVDKICERKKQLQIVAIVLNVHPKHKYQTSSGGSACNI